MTTIDRRQREREARDALILDVAERLLVERGYLGMNMDLIAQATEYSKGTIYQHYSSKEDVLAALVERMGAERVRLFERAATFRGRPRERMAAVGLSLDLFARLYPTHFKIEQIVTADSIRTKTSRARLEGIQREEERCMLVVAGIVRDGVAAGDLVLPEGTSPEGLVFGLWAMTWGGITLLLSKPDFHHVGLPEDARAVLRRNQNAVLDGYGWRPLTHEHDYDASQHRAMQEVFSDEARQAGLL